MNSPKLSKEQCRQARVTRDPRFDGQFFVAVKTTGIFCRPTCPANTPKESNIEYFFNAAQASVAGYRPCLRCRPDSAPGSWAWKGVETTFQRAVQLIEQGALQQSNLGEFAERLGISDRYLRQLFKQYLGMSPKQYAQINQLMFAKQLLHNSQLSIADVALACGFNSVRRFNDAFQKHIKLTPSDIRKGKNKNFANTLTLAYCPPYNWQHILNFYRARLVAGIEAITDDSYERTFELRSTESKGAKGWFRIQPTSNHSLTMTFSIDNIGELKYLVSTVRRMLDLDANSFKIEQHLSATPIYKFLDEGIRIPGVWSTWEAGIRAVLGQQVSVKAAVTHLNNLVATIAYKKNIDNKTLLLFPSAKKLAHADLNFLKIPQARKDTLKALAEFVCKNPDAYPEEWLAIKGIGPWTVDYAKIRGLSDPDCFLKTDLVVKKILNTVKPFEFSQLSPWGSYATFHCWNSQA